MVRGAFVIALVCSTGCADPSSSGGGGSGSSDSGDDNDNGASASATVGMSMSVGNEESTSGLPEECANGPLELPIAGCAPTPAPSSGDPHQDCVDRINQFRAECQCLPPLQRWTDAESCTNMQSAADQSGGGPHGNFGMCGESAQNTCPDWGDETQIITGCLQAMWDEGPGEPFLEHGHYINMSSLDYNKVACGFSTSASGVWSNQNFSQ